MFYIGHSEYEKLAGIIWNVLCLLLDIWKCSLYIFHLMSFSTVSNCSPYSLSVTLSDICYFSLAVTNSTYFCAILWFLLHTLYGRQFYNVVVRMTIWMSVPCSQWNRIILTPLLSWEIDLRSLLDTASNKCHLQSTYLTHTVQKLVLEHFKYKVKRKVTNSTWCTWHQRQQSLHHGVNLHHLPCKHIRCVLRHLPNWNV